MYIPREPSRQIKADRSGDPADIAQNARVVQDQEEYAARYDSLVSRYETTRVQYEEVTEQIVRKGFRIREFEWFIQTVEQLPEVVTEFDEALWGSLADHLTVHDKDRIVFTMTSGMEIKA